jgi:outer membrane lipoprotein-sorting protein
MALISLVFHSSFSSHRATTMNKILFALCLSAISVSSWAAVASCESIEEKINTKLAGKKVTGYELEVISKDTATTKRVVGVCEGGKKKIIYKKTKAKKEAE